MGCGTYSNQKVDINYIDSKGQLKSIPKKDYNNMLRLFQGFNARRKVLKMFIFMRI